jgi:hypothetical protein
MYDSYYEQLHIEKTNNYLKLNTVAVEFHLLPRRRYFGHTSDFVVFSWKILPGIGSTGGRQWQAAKRCERKRLI